MKLTIREIKERAETDDKVNFKGRVDKVWGFNDKPSKYSIGTQNIIIKDDTDKIKVIFSKIKKPEDVYKEDIEGKEVEVSGKVSIYNNEVNIFGDLKFKEEEEPKDQGAKIGGATPTAELSVIRQSGLTRSEIRLKCLFLAKDIVENSSRKESQPFITIARELEEYIRGGEAPAKAKTQATGKQKAKEEPEEEEEEGKKARPALNPEQVKQINMLMAIAENRGKEGKDYLNDLIVIKGYKSVKEFLKEDIEEATKKLKNMGTEEIPF